MRRFFVTADSFVWPGRSHIRVFARRRGVKGVAVIIQCDLAAIGQQSAEAVKTHAHYK
jgi:hypothetical protein